MEESDLIKWIREVDKKLGNHITESIKEITYVKTDVKWLKKFFWAFMTPLLSAIGAGLIYIITLLQ